MVKICAYFYLTEAARAPAVVIEPDIVANAT